MPQTTPLLPGLSPVAGKPLTATFDAGLMSSDGGVIVLREIALRLGLADVVTGPLPDDRDPTRVIHPYADMATARMMAIAAGYEDCDDLDALRTDPALKIACGRAPETGLDLMSQPTLSRLENLADRRTLKRIGLGFIDLFCNSWERVPDRIVLDIDDTGPGLDPGSRTRPAGARALQRACRRHLLPADQDLRGHLGQAGTVADPSR
jgi:hypothetical protein